MTANKATPELHEPQRGRGTVLTPELLRRHAAQSKTIAWEDQARMLLNWAADALEAADEVIRGK